MRTHRLGDVLAKMNEPADGCRIYIVRDEAVTFYVGKSARGIFQRMTDHCGMGPLQWLPDALGLLVRDNLPASEKWQLDCLTLDDCSTYTQKASPDCIEAWTDHCEQAVIRALCPCLNTAGNPRPQRLPGRYRSVNSEEAKRKAAEMLHVPYIRRMV